MTTKLLLIWVLAALCALGALKELGQRQELVDQVVALQGMRAAKMSETPLSAADYQAIQKKLPLYGTVQVSVDTHGLSVVALGLSDYAAWRLTLDRILLEYPDVSWKIDYLCSGKCPTGEAMKASLTGERKSISL